MRRKPQVSGTERAIAIRRGPTPRGPRLIQLDTADLEELFKRELRGVVLTGRMDQAQATKTCNIVDSTLEDVKGAGVDFSGCDIKDSAIRLSEFSHSRFASSSLTYDTVIQSEFDSCSFDDTDIQNCDFDAVRFVACDLRFLLVKSCTFRRCEFTGCLTNNKLFETCRFIECSFVETELQIQTISENFGLVSSRYQGTVRDDRSSVASRKFTTHEISRWLRVADADALKKLNVEYFLKETLIEGSRHLDTVVDIRSWLPMFRTAGSFVVVLNQWTNFLLWLYDNNRVTLHAVVACHSMTGSLLDVLRTKAPDDPAIAGIGAAHLAAARIVDRYLGVLEDCVRANRRTASLLVEGGGDKAHYYRALSPMFGNDGTKIVGVKPHNSPFELTVHFGSALSATLFLAIFLATRTSLELTRLRSRFPEGIEDGRRKGSKKKGATRQGQYDLQTGRRGQVVASLDFGLARSSPRPPNLRLRAYLPGNLLAELRITVGSRKIALLRKTLRDLI